jgi:ankyrin repeat protein
MIALRHDDADIVDLLLTHDADYRLKNKNGKTALDIARTRAQFNISTLFAKHDIKLKSPNNQYAKLDLESFQQSINQSTSVYKGWPLLSVASLLGEKEIVVQLINQGAKVNDRDASGYSALHRAASKGQTENINLLLANGARINMLNHKKETPLFLAAESGQFKTVKLLLKKGADTSILSEIKSSALLVSIANNHEKTAAILAPGKLDGKSIHRALTQSVISNMQDISLVLIKKDKLINQLDNNKRSTLWLSANLGRKKVVSALLREQSIELDQPDINGYSPLARSILNGHVIISKQLIARGTSLETMTSENNSLLMLSVLSEKIELTKILLDKGVNVDTKNKAGDSALMLASSAGNNDMVEMLINAGANIQTRNLDDLNAYQIALNAGHNKTAELIRDHSGKLFKIFN